MVGGWVGHSQPLSPALGSLSNSLLSVPARTILQWGIAQQGTRRGAISSYLVLPQGAPGLQGS